MMGFLVAALLCVVVTGHELEFERPGPPDTCLEGPYHKDTPSPESEEFDECLSWQDKACCNSEVPRILDQHKAVGLYNYSWDLCGNLSQACETFIKDEECFYQCEPMLGYFEIPATPGYIQHVPVCASYCQRWFDACRDDLTCVEHWLEDFDFAEDGINSCPADSSCISFADRYGDAKGLCDTMWGQAFFYSEDEDNCTVMTFDGSMGNPNFRLTFPRTGGGVGVSVGSWMLVLGGGVLAISVVSALPTL